MTIRVFVGCAKEHKLAFKVLRYSITTRTSMPVEVFPLNNADATRPDDWWRDDPLFGKYEPIVIPTPQNPKQRGATTFSFQRFLPPELVGYQGSAIYLDSDQLLRTDINYFWSYARRSSTAVLKPPGWQSAVMLMDADFCRWSIAKLIRQIDQGKRTYHRMMNLHDMGLLDEGLPSRWNVQDRDYNSAEEMLAVAPAANLLHFTDMNTQPWLRVGHAWGSIWEQELTDAIADGAISRTEVLDAINAGDVRPSLACIIGETPPYPDHQFVYPDQRARGKGLHR